LATTQGPDGDFPQATDLPEPIESRCVRAQPMEASVGKLDGQVAVITGGSSGIGLATAQLFATEGAEVVITGRHQAALDKAVELIGPKASAVRGDVAKLEDLDRIFQVVGQRHGHVDVLVANAAHVELVPIEQVTPEHFDKTFNINARGTLFTVQKALPLLREGSRVVLVSSAATANGIPEYVTYAATKAAVRSFGRTLAASLKQRGVRVNVLSPGVTDTPIIDSQVSSDEEADALRERFVETIPIGRLGHAEEIATGILFLSCDDSSYMIGNDLFVSGGLFQI
jgi:NAD(P)-dependent dehydrogenase (short-subunit alcohol dehydrogenase family)